MPAQKRWSQMTDSGIEELVRRLPTRQPAAELRERLLAEPERAGRCAAALRPAIALVVLAVLTAFDVLTLGAQERRLARPLPGSGSAAVAARPTRSDVLNDLDGLGMPYVSARVRPATDDRETYWQLRLRLLETGEGG
jgi:hypothetical protein